MENYRADGGLSITMKHINIDDHTSKGNIPMTEKFTKEKDEERKARTGLSSLAMTDAESAAVQKTPNRIALADIEAAILHTEYISPSIMPHLTICVVYLANGWAEVGHSAPADEGNFDAELGKKFAKEAAIRKLWPLFGFALRDRMNGRSPPYEGSPLQAIERPSHGERVEVQAEKPFRPGGSVPFIGEPDDNRPYNPTSKEQEKANMLEREKRTQARAADSQARLDEQMKKS